MTREERLAILGSATVAKIHRIVASAPPPPPELVEELRHILAPAMQQAQMEATVSQPLPHAA